MSHRLVTLTCYCRNQRHKNSCRSSPRTTERLRPKMPLKPLMVQVLAWESTANSGRSLALTAASSIRRCDLLRFERGTPIVGPVRTLAPGSL
jgi:hypothetical protein